MNMLIAKYIAIALAVAVVGGGAYLYLTAPKGVENTQETGEQTQNTESESGTFSGTASDLAARGGDWKCTFDHSVQGIASSGTVYVSGSSIRGDFSSKVPQLGTPVDSHMIQDGGYVYVWSSMLPGRGFKAASTAGTESELSSGGFNLNQQLDYACAPWAKDPSVFALPSGITFTAN